MWGEVLKTHDLFKDFLSKISNEVSPITYSTWFNDLELVSMDDKEIVIKVPLAVHKQILGSTYIDLLDEILLSLTNINYEFKFLTSDEITIVDTQVIETQIQEETPKGVEKRQG